MKKRTSLRAALVAGAALIAITPYHGHSQTAEALMDALVKKGVLTDQEAKDIRAELAKENRQYNKLTLGGKTVSNVNLYGDFRGRYEAFLAESPAFTDRHRFRYRLRAGLTYTMIDQFEAGLRLTSSESVGSFGGDPISGNTTFQDNGSKKFIFVDLAYGRWMPKLGPDSTMALTVGKMENPFVFSDMVFDGDYTPEGAALQFGHKLNDQHSLKFNGGVFVLDEIGSMGSDPYFYGGQIRWDAIWNKQVSSSVGLAGLNIVHDENLSNTAVPNVNRGNTRRTFISGSTTNQVPAFNFNPIIADAAVTYALDSFPGYQGAFPIRVGGDFIYNPAAPDSSDNYGYSVGVTFGKAGKKGSWEVGYTWKWLGSDAWWEEMVDSDFGAFYGGAQPLSGTSAGYGAGTNVKGHILRAAYSPFDTVTLSVKWLHTDLINPVTVANSTMNRLQVDANWKF